MAEVCRKYLVYGRVQGVFFRASTQKQAHRLGLTGHAVNLPDGRVEVLACGKPATLDALERWLQQGPDGARVDSVVTELAQGPPPRDFTTG